MTTDNALIAVMATRIRARAKNMELAAVRDEARVAERRELAALLVEFADRFAKGEAFDPATIIEIMDPPIGVFGLHKPLSSADLRKILGKDALSAAVARLP